MKRMREILCAVHSMHRVSTTALRHPLRVLLLLLAVAASGSSAEPSVGCSFSARGFFWSDDELLAFALILEHCSAPRPDGRRHALHRGRIDCAVRSARATLRNAQRT